MLRALILCGVIWLPSTASAQDAGALLARAQSLTALERCPDNAGHEDIVVCGRIVARSRYRVLGELVREQGLTGRQDGSATSES